MTPLSLEQIAAVTGGTSTFPRPDDSHLRDALRRLAEQQEMERMLELLGDMQQVAH